MNETYEDRLSNEELESLIETAISLESQYRDQPETKVSQKLKGELKELIEKEVMDLYADKIN